MEYSGTSHKGHLPIAATSLTRQLDAVPIDALLLTPKYGHLAFRKADSFFGPSSNRIVQNSLDDATAGMPLAQDCPVLCEYEDPQVVWRPRVPITM